MKRIRKTAEPISRSVSMSVFRSWSWSSSRPRSVSRALSWSRSKDWSGALAWSGSWSDSWTWSRR